jgi:hypothetical protein
MPMTHPENKPPIPIRYRKLPRDASYLLDYVY